MLFVCITNIQYTFRTRVIHVQVIFSMNTEIHDYRGEQFSLGALQYGSNPTLFSLPSMSSSSEHSEIGQNTLGLTNAFVSAPLIHFIIQRTNFHPMQGNQHPQKSFHRSISQPLLSSWGASTTVRMLNKCQSATELTLQTNYSPIQPHHNQTTASTSFRLQKGKLKN